MIVGSAGGAPVLGLEPHKPCGGDSCKRFGGRDLVGVELTQHAREQDRHLAHLAVVGDGHEQGGGDVVALDQLGADELRAARVRHMQARARGDDGCGAGRIGLEGVAATFRGDVDVTVRIVWRGCNKEHRLSRNPVE